MANVVNIIPDHLIEKIAIRFNGDIHNFSILDINPEKEYTKEIIITPHFRENYGNIGFLKLKLYCDKHKIKLTSYGLLNQLPVFSVFSDRVILHENKEALQKLYQGVSVSGGNKKFISVLSNAEYSEVYMTFQNYIKLMNPEKGVADHNCIYLERAVKEISNEEVASHFHTPAVLITETAYKVFQKLDLPHNVIMCEFKPTMGPNSKRNFSKPIIDWVYEHETRLSLPIMGIDRNFQNNLLQQVQSNFMSIQILASLINKWFFMCFGGSSNLMCLLPVYNMTLYDFWLNGNTSVLNAIQKMSELRYGQIGKNIPISFDNLRIVKNKLTRNLDKINQFIEQNQSETIEIGDWSSVSSTI